MVRNAYRNRHDLVEEFITNPRARMKYAGGRMYTRESPDSDGIQLVAYGNEIIAEHDGSELTFFIGHYQDVSKTVTDYVRLFGKVLSNGGFSQLTIDVREESPTNGYIARRLNSPAAQFIGNYIGDFEPESEWSDVERDAVNTVEEALEEILALEFGSDEE